MANGPRIRLRASLISMMLALISMGISGWSVYNVRVSYDITRELSLRLLLCQSRNGGVQIHNGGIHEITLNK